MKRGLTRICSLLLAIFLMAGLVGLLACGEAAAPTPDVTISSPSDDTEIEEEDITVSIDVSDFDIVDKLGESAESGEGHIHYYMDVTPPTTPGQPAVSEAGTYAATTDTSYTWAGVGPGTHTFSVQLVNNDHTPLVPPVIDEVMVTVAAGGSTPNVMITSPADGTTLTAGNVEVSVSVSNFNLVDKLGQDAVSGEGHIHYYLDVEVPTTAGEPAVSESGTYAVGTSTTHTWDLVEAGERTFSVQLVNNDHTPLEPPVVDSVDVTVEPEAAEPVTVELSADNVAFDKSEITVPAGAMVTIEFNNMENIPHNFAVYETSAATTSIFVGDVITGPRVIEYTFTAPETPGDYFFRCDIHPTIMTGTFVVE